MNLRRAVPSDAEALYELAVAAIRGSAAEHYTAAELDAWAGRLDVAQHERLIAAQHVLVAVDGEAVAGFASVALEPVDTLVAGEVDRLFVSPAFGGRGVARLLLDAVEAAARDAGLAELVTHASWRAAPVFARHGYVQVEVEHVTIGAETLTRARMVKALGDESSRLSPSQGA